MRKSSSTVETAHYEQRDSQKEETQTQDLQDKRGATDKETMWMLMRDKPTRYHNDNDTNNMKDILLFVQTQRTHPFLEHSCKATPLRGFERRCLIGQSMRRC